MADIIDGSVLILEEVISHYGSEPVKNELEMFAKNITSSILSILDENAKAFNLVITNSVATKKLYNISYRIKILIA